MKKKNYYLLTVTYMSPLSGMQGQAISLQLPFAIEFEAGNFNAGGCHQAMKEAGKNYLNKAMKNELIDINKLTVQPFFLYSEDSPIVAAEPQAPILKKM